MPISERNYLQQLQQYKIDLKIKKARKKMTEAVKKKKPSVKKEIAIKKLIYNLKKARHKFNNPKDNRFDLIRHQDLNNLRERIKRIPGIKLTKQRYESFPEFSELSINIGKAPWPWNKKKFQEILNSNDLITQSDRKDNISNSKESYPDFINANEPNGKPLRTYTFGQSNGSKAF